MAKGPEPSGPESRSVPYRESGSARPEPPVNDQVQGLRQPDQGRARLIRGFTCRGKLPGLLAPVRATVLTGLARNLAGKPGLLKFAAENVLPLEGFAHDAPGNPREAVEVFACATIGIHSDEGLVARYSNLFYLGCVDGTGGGAHVLHASVKPGTADSVREQVSRKKGTIVAHVLEPGDHILLDGHCPHWLTAMLGNRELGEPLGEDPDPTIEPAWMAGVPRKAVTAMFVAYTADECVPQETFAGVLRSLRAM